VTAEIQPLLDELLVTLTRAEVPVVPALRPGLSPEAIATAAATLPWPLPPSLAALHAWRDGTDWTASSNATRAIEPFGDLLSLDEAIEQRTRELQMATMVAGGNPDEAEQVWSSRWLPLFDQGNGDMVVVVCGPGAGEGSVRSMLRESRDESIELHADIAEMVEFLIRAYRSGAARVRADETGFRVIDTDEAAFAAIRRELRPVPEEQWKRWVGALGSDDWGEGMAQLRYMRPPEAVPALIETLLRGSSDTGRGQAATTLAYFGDESAIPPLITAAADLRIADSALRSLYTLAGEAWLSHVIAALADPDPSRRANAETALVHAATAQQRAQDEAREALRGLAETLPTAELRAAARRGLERLGPS
jgi:cell wall assembly regulator SMI1